MQRSATRGRRLDAARGPVASPAPWPVLQSPSAPPMTRTHAMPVSFLALFLLAADPTPIPAGSATLTLDVGKYPLKVNTYKPANYRDGPLVLVFHGVLRNADEYRDHAKVIADRCGGLVAAPEFDEARFPFWAYQRGGLVRDGKPQP